MIFKWLFGNVFWFFYNLIFYVFNIKKRMIYKDIKFLKNVIWKYYLGRVEMWIEEFCDIVGNNIVGIYVLLIILDYGLLFCFC